MCEEIFPQITLSLFLFCSALQKRNRDKVIHECFLKGLSHEIDFNFNNKKTELGLTKGRGWFLNFKGSPMIFKMQKRYIFAVNAILRWLNNG
jgi:hypothetical protein